MEAETLTIGPYAAGLAAGLSAAWRAAQPEFDLSARELDNRCRAVWQANGRLWVLFAGRQAVGLALAAPVPGLPGLFELDGFVAPKWQRRGLGSRALQQVLRDVRGTAVRQLSHPVTDLGSPAARFLLKHQFAVEHVEWLLARPVLPVSQPPADVDVTWMTLSRAEAITQFCRLHQQSFVPFPWYQPYTAEEVAAELADAGDLLFLRRAGVLLGFAWLRWPEEGVGQIEPMGIVAGEQGKGYGRFLLQVALQQLAQRGAHTARIGTWAQNETAVALYQSMGFRHQESITYLAYDLEASIVNRK